MVTNKIKKFKRGLKPIKYFMPFFACAICFCLVFRLVEFDNLKGLSLAMLFLAIYFLACAIYYFSGFLLSLKGRYLIVSDDEIYIDHEYISKFDKRIKISEIESVIEEQAPIPLIILTLKNSNKVILSSELLLESKIHEVYEAINEYM
jgi:hypothetical protein